MRIGFNTKYDWILADLERLSSEITLTQLKISSGKNFLYPSDNPSEIRLSIHYKQSIARVERYQRTIDEGIAFLKAQESALAQVEDLIARAKVLAIQSVNDINDKNIREAIAKEIGSIIETILSLANSQLGEKYIFAGQKTTGYTPGEKPFKLIKESLPDGQIIEKVIYNGSIKDLTLEYDKNMKIKLGRNGQVIFMDSGIFETLIGLKRTLEANNIEDFRKEQYDIQKFIAKLDDIYNYIASIRGETGTKIRHLEVKKNLYEKFKDTLKTNLGNIEGADLTKLATDLQRLITAYDAALRATVIVSDLSLVKYL
ncbi:flagellar hook-associated protein 3 [Candidatus Pacearchaeota archaeon]|nr:MAG: flagellar hook-associated protein 3 [Candidatus Pacearchaeota archaeon]